MSIGEERPAWLPRAELQVVGFRIVGTETVFEIPSGRGFSLGTSETHDVTLPDATVSSSHCIFEWRGRELWLQDLKSKNGTYVNGVKTERARVVDGTVLLVGRTTLVAFAEESRHRKSRDELLEGRDPKFRIAVDAALGAAMRGEPVVIVGETGVGRSALARAIHEVAVGPHLPFMHVKAEGRATEIEEAKLGTVYVDGIDEQSEPQQTYLLSIFRASLLLHGATGGIHFVLGVEREPLFVIDGATIVHLPPLRERGDDVLLLVDLFAKAHFGHDADRHVFSDETIEGLRRYAWPGNVAELKEAVERLATITKHGTVRAAAEATGLSKSALTDWLYRRKIPVGRG